MKELDHTAHFIYIIYTYICVYITFNIKLNQNVSLKITSPKCAKPDTMGATLTTWPVAPAHPGPFPRPPAHQCETFLWKCFMVLCHGTALLGLQRATMQGSWLAGAGGGEGRKAV